MLEVETALISFLCSALALRPPGSKSNPRFKNPRSPRRCFVAKERSSPAAVPAVPPSSRSAGGAGSGTLGGGRRTAEPARRRRVGVPELERPTHTAEGCAATPHKINQRDTATVQVSLH